MLSQRPYGLPFFPGCVCVYYCRIYYMVLGKRGVKLDIHCGLAAIPGRNSSQVCGDFLRKPCMHLQDHHVSSTKFRGVEGRRARQSIAIDQNGSRIVTQVVTYRHTPNQKKERVPQEPRPYIESGKNCDKATRKQRPDAPLRKLEKSPQSWEFSRH